MIDTKYCSGYNKSNTRNFVRVYRSTRTADLSTKTRKIVREQKVFQMGDAAMEVQCRKEYVSVNLDVDRNGVVHPRFIRWANGRIFQIDQLKYKCRAASTKVMIHGKETFLFSEGNKWFVEAKEASQ